MNDSSRPADLFRRILRQTSSAMPPASPSSVFLVPTKNLSREQGVPRRHTISAQQPIHFVNEVHVFRLDVRELSGLESPLETRKARIRRKSARRRREKEDCEAAMFEGKGRPLSESGVTQAGATLNVGLPALWAVMVA